MKKFFICFFIFLGTGLGSAFLGVPGDLTFVVGGVCALLYLILSRKKGKSKSPKTSVSPSRASSTSNRPSSHTDYFDPRNIPSHWVKARICIDGHHAKNTISRGDADRCFECGKPFDGEWGDRGVFDGYVCQIHQKWIPGGSYCAQCKNEGYIK